MYPTDCASCRVSAVRLSDIPLWWQSAIQLTNPNVILDTEILASSLAELDQAHFRYSDGRHHCLAAELSTKFWCLHGSLQSSATFVVGIYLAKQENAAGELNLVTNFRRTQGIEFAPEIQEFCGTLPLELGVPG